ncbi:MAG: amino protease [Paenibacillaceae bacterium]|jgi:abortive infection bacteriophage resistance protein|nr:amino protease [Paenibacillaceae bacterium]
MDIIPINPSLPSPAVPSLKPPTTFEEQILLLESRGIVVSDRAKAIKILSTLNYYRFSAYALTFKADDRYVAGTSFDLLFRHYEFDRKLRLLFMEIIEPIEIAFRTHNAYLIAHTYGSEGHKEALNFKRNDFHASFLKELNDALQKSSKDLFIKHHIDHYNNRFPVWVALEVATIGMISKLFANMKTKDKKKISRDYYSGTSHKEIENWLKCITVLRNKCAHYSRLFNCTFPHAIKLPKGYDAFISENSKLIGLIISIKHLTKDSYWNIWSIKFLALIEEFHEIDITHLGLVGAWRSIFAQAKP